MPVKFPVPRTDICARRTESSDVAPQTSLYLLLLAMNRDFDLPLARLESVSRLYRTQSINVRRSKCTRYHKFHSIKRRSIILSRGLNKSHFTQFCFLIRKKSSNFQTNIREKWRKNSFDTGNISVHAHRPTDPKLRNVENRATELWIKQMTAIIVIIRIMISECEVGSLGLTSSH